MLVNIRRRCLLAEALEAKIDDPSSFPLMELPLKAGAIKRDIMVVYGDACN